MFVSVCARVAEHLFSHTQDMKSGSGGNLLPSPAAAASATSLMQSSSPTLGVGFTGEFSSARDSINVGATASDLDASAQQGDGLLEEEEEDGEVDFRRVLGEDSVIEVELIRVDPDDLEGPLGMAGGRLGVSGTSSAASTGWSTPQSARNSMVRLR